jgi:hypothetical protein
MCRIRSEWDRHLDRNNAADGLGVREIFEGAAYRFFSLSATGRKWFCTGICFLGMLHPHTPILLNHSYIFHQTPLSLSLSLSRILVSRAVVLRILNRKIWGFSWRSLVRLWSWGFWHRRLVFIYLFIYLSALSVTLYSAELLNDWENVEGSGRGLILRHFLGMLLEGLRETTKNLSQDCRCYSRNSNRAPP